MGNDGGKGWFATIFSPSQKTNNQVRKGVLQQRATGVVSMNLAMINQEKVDNNYVMVRAWLERTETRLFLILTSKIGKHTRQGLKRNTAQMEWQNDG